MKILNEASRLFFAMFALILVAMLTTPSSLTNSDGTLVAHAHKKSIVKTTKAKNKSGKSGIASKHQPTKFGKNLADLF